MSGRRAVDGLYGWRVSVRTRDGYRCRRCGRRAKSIHHLLQYATHPHLRLSVENGIVLCRKCHRWADSNPEECRAWISQQSG